MLSENTMNNIAIIGKGKYAKMLVKMVNIILKIDPEIFDAETLEKIEEINNIKNKNVTHFIVGIGDNQLRKEVFKKAINIGLTPYTIVSKNAYISEKAKIGKGCVIMPGATIQIGAQIEDNCIINTNSCIDHDCIIKSHVHISSGATVTGSVIIGEETFIGAGSSIKDYIKIGKQCIVGVGTVVVKDIPNNSIVVGVPAKNLK